MVSWSAPPLPPRIEATRRTTLVGRRRELETLDLAWEAVEAGQRQVVFVGGEPGAGKTRLVAELAGAVTDGRGAVLIGTSRAEASTPYQPIREMLDHLLLSNPGQALTAHFAESGSELRRLTGAGKQRIGASEPFEPMGEVRKDLFDAVGSLARLLAADRPTVLVFEDIHWAQPPTMALLEHIVQTTPDSRLLVMATMRTTSPDRSDELTQRMAEMHRIEGVRRIDLPGLDIEAIAEYVSRQAGIPLREARAPAAILRDRTGGNPFFLREIWLDLEQQGGVSAIHSTQRVPASIGDTLKSRLDGLGSEIRQVIEMAAILGDGFELSTLVTASEVDRTRTLAAIDSAVALRLIEPTAGFEASYSFVHSLSRQSVLDLMPRSRRAILHARAAEALEQGTVDETLVPRLAQHFLAAQVLGYQDRALHYCEEAGRLAERALAFEEAALWFERSATLPGASRSEKAELLHSAAQNHVRSGAFAKGRDLFEQLARSSEPLVSLRGSIGYEDANWRPGIAGPRAADLLARSIENCGLGQDDPMYIVALASLGRALAFAGETERARQVGNRAIGLAREHGVDRALRHALKASLWHGLTPDVAEVQLARSRELSRMSTESSDWEGLGAAAYFRAMVGYLSGNPEDVEQGQIGTRMAARSTGQQFFEYVAACISGGMAFVRGDFESATRWASDALTIGQGFGTAETEGPHGVQMFLISRETGRLERFRHFFDGSESFHGRWVPGLLAVYTELGMQAGIRRALRHLLNRELAAHRSGAQWPLELVFMVEGALALGDEEAGLRLIPLLEEYEGMNLIAGQFVAPLGSADRYLARLHALSGGSEFVRPLFDSALALDEAMGSVVHSAETLAHHALFALESGDGTGASHLAERASSLAESIGQRRVIGLLETLDAPRSSASGLTEREIDVLKLVAEGLSNREISEALFISHNTTANHVRSILIKTGAANRTQAAMFAAENDLL